MKTNNTNALRKRLCLKHVAIFFIVIVIVGLVTFSEPVHAAETDVTKITSGLSDSAPCTWWNLSCWPHLFIASIVTLFISIIGYFITAAVGYLIWIGSYNGFIDAEAVKLGWSVMRDLSNMFFVLVLLIISFGTILHVQQYQMKSLLPKVILMAILVNFSKAIAGIFIDFAQVVMLTFVAAYQNAGAGNFLKALNLEEILKITPKDDVTILGIAGSYLFALALAIVSLVVIAAFLLIFVVRIVALWLLVIFSPLAYVLSVVPAGQKYAQQWWDMFSKYVIIGPVLAFFLWLSLATLPTIRDQPEFDPNKSNLQQRVSSETSTAQQPAQVPNIGIISAGEAKKMMGFLISIAMLMMSLVFAQQIGGAAGKIAGNAYGKLQAGGGWLANKAFRGATYLPREYGKRVGYGTADTVLGAVGRNIGMLGIGNAALKARSKLQMKREYEEEKDKRYLNYMSEDDHDTIIRRSLTPGILNRMGVTREPRVMTESARTMAKHSKEWKMQKGQTFTSPEARRQMAQGAAATDPAVIQANKGYYTQMISSLMEESGHDRDWENNDRYRDQQLGSVIEGFLSRMPHLIDITQESMQRRVTARGGPVPVGAAAGPNDANELIYRVRRINEQQLRNIPAPALGDEQLTNALFSADLEKLDAALESRRAMVTRLQVQGLVPPGGIPDLIDAQGNALPPEFQVYREQFRKWHRVRAQETGQKAAMADRAWSRFASNPANIPNDFNPDPNVVNRMRQLVNDGNVQRGFIQGRSMADIDKKKLEETQSLHKKYGDNYIESAEYKKQPNQYFDKEAYIATLQQLAENSIRRPEDSDIDSVSGIRKIIRRAAAATKSGQDKYKEARVAIDFDKLGLSGAGYETKGEGKEELIKKIATYLKQRGDYAPDEISNFEDAAKRANQFSLINKGRTAGSARYILTHESAHERGESNPELVKQSWMAMDANTRAKTLARIRQEWNKPDMTEDKAAHEYFADATANETRWKRQGGMTFNDDSRQIVKAAGISQELTRPVVPVTGAQLANALGTKDTSVVDAVDRLSQILDKQVGSGLNALSGIGTKIAEAVGAFSASGGVDVQSMTEQLRRNGEIERRTERNMKDLLKRYHEVRTAG